MREELAHMVIAEPPEFLFKAVGMEFIDLTFRRGLNRRKMPFIDVYETETEAKCAFGHRKQSYVFSIRSGEMHKQGYIFYKLETGTWGTDEIPQKYMLLNG